MFVLGVIGELGSPLCPECREYMPDEKASDVPSQEIPSLFSGNVITRNINGLRVYASLSYDARARKIIRAFKHAGDRNLCRVLGKNMAEMFGECEADVLIPVPLHIYSGRKYNQSLELAEGMRDVWGSVRLTDAAIWTREVWSSRGITHEDFRFTKDICGLRVALVDDFCATGRTLSCLAETCRREGAQVICAYTLAAQTPPDSLMPRQDSDSPSSSDILARLSEERYRELYAFFAGEVIVRQVNSLTVYAASDYHAGGIREEIHKLKYSGAINLCAYFGKHMAEKFGECRADYLLPVPLHLNSEREYNQSLELAEGMCELWNVKILDAAVWTREVPRRAVSNDRRDLTPSDFGITQDIRGRRIALVDDVCTSGMTLSCLAESCRLSGAVVVCAYTLASV